MDSANPKFEPDRAEWQFDNKALLPDWQCRFCANYEYARESPSFQNIVTKRPEGLPSMASGPVWVLQDFLVKHVPEFPSTPWQKIDPERRRDLLARIEITKASRVSGIRDFGSPENYFMELNSGKSFGCLDDDASVVMAIDFSEHDSFLVSDFARWLKSKRAELTAASRKDAAYYLPRKNRRGQGLNDRVWVVLLRRLGQYRKWAHLDKRPDAQIFKRPTKRQEAQRKEVERLVERFGGMRKIGFVI